MPYKDPERKRRWEREHREQRNAQRRVQRSGTMTRPLALNPEPKTFSGQEPKNGWKLLIGLAIGLAIALVGALSGARLSKGH